MSQPLVLFVPGYPEAIPARQLAHRFAHALALGGKGNGLVLPEGAFDAVQYVSYVDEGVQPEKQALVGRATSLNELKFYGEVHESILSRLPGALRPPDASVLLDPFVASMDDLPIGALRSFFAVLWEYATDKGFRYQAQDLLRQRLLAAKDRPVLVVAHGFGAVLVYDTLYKEGLAAPRVELVTLGAPLGLAVTQRRLKAKVGADGFFAVPERIVSWTNVCGVNDPVGAGARLGEDFRWSESSLRVDDRPAELDSGWPHHRWEGYLRAPLVRELAGEFLRRRSRPTSPLRAG